MRAGRVATYHQAMRLWVSCSFAVMLCVSLSGCTHSTEVLSKSTKTYTIKGVVIYTTPVTGEVMLQHEAIAGFMDAMTMPYQLEARNTITELHPGDRIMARLVVDQDANGVYRHARLNQVVITAQARPDYKPAVQYHVPTAGDVVPDFHLVDQDGHAVRLSQFHGRALLITFIYTRCPLGDFCAKMGHNFATIDAALKSSAALYAQTDLLSISFDPAFDTPMVLRAYGNSYLPDGGKGGFAHWQFAAPAKGQLLDMQHFFNVGATPSETGAIDHSLSTILIGPDGKIAAWYPGNEWDPQTVIAQFHSLLHL